MGKQSGERQVLRSASIKSPFAVCTGSAGARWAAEDSAVLARAAAQSAVGPSATRTVRRSRGTSCLGSLANSVRRRPETVRSAGCPPRLDRPHDSRPADRVIRGILRPQRSEAANDSDPGLLATRRNAGDGSSPYALRAVESKLLGPSECPRWDTLRRRVRGRSAKAEVLRGSETRSEPP